MVVLKLRIVTFLAHKKLRNQVVWSNGPKNHLEIFLNTETLSTTAILFNIINMKMKSTVLIKRYT